MAEPENADRQYTQTIDYIEDLVGADIDRDAIRVILESQDVTPLTVAQQNPVKIEGDDDEGVTNEVAAEALNDGLPASTIGVVTWIARALNDIGADELVSRITDSAGSQIDPSLATDYPDNFAEKDLSSGDLVVGPVNVGRSQAVVVSAYSEDGANWEATVDWQSDNGDRIIRQTPSDVGLNGVTEDYSRLIRKGQQVQVTFSDTSGGTNNINAFVDAHR